MKSKKYISWTDLEICIGSISMQIHISKKKYSNIYGIPRGGLIPGCMLSHKLNIPMITDVNKITPNTLIIDDIIDSGNTIKSFIEKNDIASIFLSDNYKGTLTNIIHARKSSIDTWIVFPYENDIDMVSNVLINGVRENGN